MAAARTAPASGAGHTLHVIAIAGTELDAVRAVVNHHFHLPTFDGWTAKFDVAQQSVEWVERHAQPSPQPSPQPCL